MNWKSCLTLSLLCTALNLPGQQVSDPEAKPARLDDDVPRGQVSDPEDKPPRLNQRLLNRRVLEIRRAELSEDQKAVVDRFEKLPRDEQTKVLYQIAQVEDPEQLEEFEETAAESPSASEVFPESTTTVRVTIQFTDGQSRTLFLKIEEWERMAAALNRYYEHGQPGGVLMETFRPPEEDAGFIHAVAFSAIQQIEVTVSQ